MNLGRFGGIVLVAALVMAIASPAPAGRPATTPAPHADMPITFYGRAGSFGGLRDTVASGQELSRAEVPAWGFTAGRHAGRSVVATDGSVLMAGRSHTNPATGEMAIGAFDPGGSGFSTIRFTTSKGRPFVLNADRYRVAPTVSDLLALPGNAVAFTAWPSGFGPDRDATGVWPVFGVLTKTGAGWVVTQDNQWTGADLGKLACPPDPHGNSDCLRPQAMARLPGSGDIVVAQALGALTVLRLTGPDPQGRFAVKVTGHYRYPVPNVSPREVHTDPTGVPGTERFVVGFDVPNGPGVMQEFRYDAKTGDIGPLSAPVLPGDATAKKTALYGFGAGSYDHAGNLWLTRRDRDQGGKLAVYGRKGLCPHDPQRTFASYATLAAWGKACPPDYDILQARQLREVRDVVAIGDTIAVLDRGGLLLPIRATGSGAGLRFEIGNLVDLGHKLLAKTEVSVMDSRIAGAGRAGRLWLSTSRVGPAAEGAVIDHWMVSIDLAGLFSPRPVRLPDRPGHAVTIQAERTMTIGTEQRRGAHAAVDVDSLAYVAECADSPLRDGCGYDGVPGNGFVLKDDSIFGFMPGFVEYRVEVPSNGSYRLSYFAGTYPNTKDVQFELSVAGRTYVTPFYLGGNWGTVRAAEAVTLTAGVHTIRLTAQVGRHGWFLNSFTLQRV